MYKNIMYMRLCLHVWCEMNPSGASLSILEDKEILTVLKQDKIEYLCFAGEKIISLTFFLFHGTILIQSVVLVPEDNTLKRKRVHISL